MINVMLRPAFYQHVIRLLVFGSAQVQAQEKQEAQRDVYLKKCNQIKKGLSDLSKAKTVSRIKEFDAATEEQTRKVLLQVEEIIKLAQSLKDQLEGK